MNFDLVFLFLITYNQAMNGHSELKNGLSRHLRDSLIVGKIYSLDEISALIGWQPQAARGKGVLSPSSSDAQLLLMHLEKDSYSTQSYTDHLYGSTLFWSGQNKIKSAEKALLDGAKDTFIFIQERRKTPYIYYGRAVPIRMQIEWELGKPSHIAFDLPEYEDFLHIGKKATEDLVIKEKNVPFAPHIVPDKTEDQRFTKIRIAQTQYRKDVISLWHNKCAVTGVDEADWLIASHIKPWRESTDIERVDPNNGLLLTPNYDKLFDRGVISFSPDNGRIILPETQSKQMWSNFTKMHIDDSQSLRYLDDKIAEYLEYHNNYVFKFEPTIKYSEDDYLDCVIAKSFS